MKRVSAFLLAVSLMVMPAFAWESGTFAGNYYTFEQFSPYLVESPAYYANAEVQSVAAAADTSGAASTTLSAWEFVQRLSVDSSTVGLGGVVNTTYGHDDITVGGVYLPAVWQTGNVITNMPFSAAAHNRYENSGQSFIRSEFPLDTTDIKLSNPGDGWSVYYNDLRSFRSGPVGFDTPANADVAGSRYMAYNVDLSGLGEFYSFQFHGGLLTRSGLLPSTVLANGVNVELYVNGSLVRTFYNRNGICDFGDFYYSSSTPITSMSFRAYFHDFSYTSLPFSGTGYFFFMMIMGSTFTVLNGAPAIIQEIGEGRDNLNEHEALESEWGASMVDNFNALGLSDFEFPSGLLGAFALITSIFMSLWNAFGEYKILFILPLTLGIVLLVIGRIPKSGGHGGDDDDYHGPDYDGYSSTSGL